MYLPGPIRFAKCQVCSRCMIVHKNMTRTWQDHSNTSAVQLQSRVRTVSRHTNACESAECPRLGAIVSAGLRSRPPCTRTLLENGRTLGPPGPPCGLVYTVPVSSMWSENTRAHTPGQRNHIHSLTHRERSHRHAHTMWPLCTSVTQHQVYIIVHPRTPPHPPAPAAPSLFLKAARRRKY